MFAFLILQLLKLGIAPYPVTTSDLLYFSLNKVTFYIVAVDESWLLVRYTYQHNAPSILDSAEIFRAGHWRQIIKSLVSSV